MRKIKEVELVNCANCEKTGKPNFTKVNSNKCDYCKNTGKCTKEENARYEQELDDWKESYFSNVLGI